MTVIFTNLCIQCGIPVEKWTQTEPSLNVKTFQSSQGFDAGEDTYQQPPADSSSVTVDVDPNRLVLSPALGIPAYQQTIISSNNPGKNPKI